MSLFVTALSEVR